MLDQPHQRVDISLEPLDDYLVVETLDESELPSGLIVPANEAAQCRSGIVAAVGPNLDQLKPAEAKIVHQVTFGGAIMPPFKAQLTPKQIQDVAAFVYTSTH